jgi:ABC-type glycerol-3-phosphate transport system substrate-binding protein
MPVMERMGRHFARKIIVTVFLGAATAASAAEKIVVYTVIPEGEINRAISQEFTRRTGIEVEMLNVPATGTLSARIRSEKGHSRADIFADAPIDFHQALAKDGLPLPAYTRALDKNVRQHTPSAPLTVTLVEQGEAPVGPSGFPTSCIRKIFANSPLTTSYPPTTS